MRLHIVEKSLFLVNFWGLRLYSDWFCLLNRIYWFYYGRFDWSWSLKDFWGVVLQESKEIRLDWGLDALNWLSWDKD